MPNEVSSAVYQLFVGLDISAALFSAAQAKGEAKPQKASDYAQNSNGFERFQKDLVSSGMAASAILVVMEANRQLPG